MVGIVLSRSTEGENIGYVIPNEEIDLFLEDVKSGRYQGKPADQAGTGYQRLENKGLRSFLKLDERVKGVLVVPPPRKPANYPFLEFDVLTKIGNYEIDNEGTVRLPNDLRIGFHGVIPRLAQANAVPVTIIRNGKLIEVSLPVSTRDTHLIRPYRGEKPSYFIHGPLVFSPARGDAVQLYSRLNPLLYYNQSPLLAREFDRIQFPEEELVVVTAPLFTHKIAKGYEDPVGHVVKDINGIKIRNLRHLVETLRDSTEEFLTFRFAELGAQIMVFRRGEMNKATEEILEDNGISASRRGSEDVLKVWKQKDRGRR